MAYTPPAANAVDFDIGAYTPPASNAVDFELASTLGAYTLTAQGGSYSLTGASAALQRSKRIVANGGSYTLAGQSASLLRSKLVTAQGGAYTYAGQSAGLFRSRLIVASGGGYTLAGQSADITYTPGAGNYDFILQGGSYTLAGGMVTLLRSKNLVANGGTYTYAGANVTITNTGEETPPVVVKPSGGIGHSRKRKRYFLERDGNYLLFDTRADVERYIDQEESAKPTQKAKPKKVKRKVNPVEPTVINKESLQKFAETQETPEIIPELIEEQNFELLMDIFQKYEMWRDEQDVEILLLH